MRVPPGVSRADYGKALAEFENAVGREWVFTSDEDLDLYRDAYSPFLHEPEELIAAVRSRRPRPRRCSRSCGSPIATASRCIRSRPARISATAARRPRFPAAWCST